MGIVVLVACGAGAVSGLAQAPGEPQMSAEQKAAMAAWTKAMTPGKEHQEMASRIGTWQGKVSMWEAPEPRRRSVPESPSARWASAVAS
jgi:hypothetical protein